MMVTQGNNIRSYGFLRKNMLETQTAYDQIRMCCQKFRHNFPCGEYVAGKPGNIFLSWKNMPDFPGRFSQV